METLSDISCRSIDLKLYEKEQSPLCTCAAISPEERLLLTGFENGTFALWSLPDFKLITSDMNSTGKISGATWLSENQFVLTSTAGRLSQWRRISDGSFEIEEKFFVEIGELTNVIYHHPSLQLLVTGKEGFRIYLTRWVSGEIRLITEEELRQTFSQGLGAYDGIFKQNGRFAIGYRGIFPCLKVATSAGGSKYLTGIGPVRSTRTIKSICKLPNGKLMTRCANNSLHYWSFDDMPERHFCLDILAERVEAMTSSQSEKRLIISTNCHSIFLVQFGNSYRRVEGYLPIEKNTLHAPAEKLILFGNERYLFCSSGTKNGNPMILDFRGENFGKVPPKISELEELFRC